MAPRGGCSRSDGRKGDWRQGLCSGQERPLHLCTPRRGSQSRGTRAAQATESTRMAVGDRGEKREEVTLPWDADSPVTESCGSR